MKQYVLDTNVLLSDPQATLAFEDNVVILPFTVLEELDSIKSRKVDISRDARHAIRLISDILENATHEEIAKTGVPLNRKYKTMSDDSLLKIITLETLANELNSSDGLFSNDFSKFTPDDKIIEVAKLTGSILVTRDINMRLKAMASGVEVQDYRHDITIEDSDLLHVGYHDIDVDFWGILENTSTKENQIHTEQRNKKLLHMIPEELLDFMPKMCIGDYFFDNNDVMMVFDGYAHVIGSDDEEQDDKSYMVFIDVGKSKAMNKKIWGIKSKNVHQSMAINSILDPDVHITVLLGSAGTGKTLITIAAALELVMEKHQYSRIIFSKTQDSQFEDIGFLPGSEAEKVIPFCGAAVDALEYLHKDDVNPEGSIKEIMSRNVFQFKALNFVRGRSFMDTILIVDEFQNITPAMAKTILTRAGQNCKVIIMGNLSQIDNQYISPTNSGLTYVTEKFKDWNGCRIVELEGVVRSPLAEFAEKNL